MPAREARKLMGPDLTLGVTCKGSRDLAMQAGEDGADYVAFGAFYPVHNESGDRTAGPRNPAMVVRDDGTPELCDRRHNRGELHPTGASRRGFPGGGGMCLEPPGWAGGRGESAQRGDPCGDLTGIAVLLQWTAQPSRGRRMRAPVRSSGAIVRLAPGAGRGCPAETAAEPRLEGCIWATSFAAVNSRADFTPAPPPGLPRCGR